MPTLEDRRATLLARLGELDARLHAIEAELDLPHSRDWEEDAVEREGDDPLVISIDVEGIGRPGRNKVNCTAPASDGSGDFYWYAVQWKISS